MHGLDAKALAWVLCAGLIAWGCASTNAPDRWLPEPENVPLDAYGSWMRVRSDSGQVLGELIAFAHDTVFVADSVLHAIPSGIIKTARLVKYDEAGLIGAAVPLGFLSTVSNGWYLVFTGPLWLIGGTIAAIARALDPIIDYPGEPLAAFRAYARFPQGLPTGIDRSSVRMKPPGNPAERPRRRR
jgi:hypothetical protein